MSTNQKEAEKQWCQESFTAQRVINEHGAVIQEAGPWTCKTTACMAWRWDGSYGYCGKAGKP